MNSSSVLPSLLLDFPNEGNKLVARHRILPLQLVSQQFSLLLSVLLFLNSIPEHLSKDND